VIISLGLFAFRNSLPVQCWSSCNSDQAADIGVSIGAPENRADDNKIAGKGGAAPPFERRSAFDAKVSFTLWFYQAGSNVVTPALADLEWQKVVI
jgi:hypothetical protein